MRPSIPTYGQTSTRPSVEEMIYQKMEFRSDAEANKYARFVLGHSCFAVVLTESELNDKHQLEQQFSKKFI